MAQYKDRECFLRIRLRALLELLDKELANSERETFGRLCRLLQAVFHYEYHHRLEALKDAYAAFDPDVDKSARPVLGADDRGPALDGLFANSIQLLERTNYKRLNHQEIQDAIRQGASDWGLNMAVDFDAFDRLEVFACGDTMGKRYRRRLLNLWRLEDVEVPIYQRLVLILKLKARECVDAGVDTEDVFLKLFKDIPKVDLEMLLPGTQVHMPLLQRLKLGGSLMSSLGFLLWKIAAEMEHLVSAVLQRQPLVFWGPISLAVGYGYKQYQGFQTTKQSYSLMLTQSLYYQNLDNNAGVFTRLLDVAEEQECREALLAYFFLWRHTGGAGCTAAELDDVIEEFLKDKANVKVDFEIDDALAKLERLGLVGKTEGRYTAQPIQQALEQLDVTWDNYFKYGNDTLPQRAVG